MPPVRFSVSKYYICIVAVILLHSKIMPTYSCCAEKKLVYIIIITPFSCQPSSYSKYIKLNIYLSYNIQSVLDIKYAFLFILSLSYSDSGITQQCTALLAHYYIL